MGWRPDVAAWRWAHDHRAGHRGLLGARAAAGRPLRSDAVLAVGNLLWFVFAGSCALTVETTMVPRRCSGRAADPSGRSPTRCRTRVAFVWVSHPRAGDMGCAGGAGCTALVPLHLTRPLLRRVVPIRLASKPWRPWRCPSGGGCCGWWTCCPCPACARSALSLPP
ncbi:hypothetical protein I552_0036 [Mycobacterium xenopi 3993]|nr:hypothetical protein I552_0036 [Mycobacterium xenopi 3993]